MKYTFSLLFLILFSAATFANTKKMSFTENIGQLIDASHKLRNDILFTSESGGVELYFQKNTVSLVFSEIKFKGKDKLNPKKETNIDLIESENSYRMDLEFLNTNSNCIVKAEDYTTDYLNFYYPHCQQGITNVRNCKRIRYLNIYSNIDIVFYGMNDGSLKYDFIVKPGGNPNEIKYKYNGASSQNINERGELIIENVLGGVIEKQPYSFQLTSLNKKSFKQKVSTHYNINNNIIGLIVDSYDSAKTLTIDPWATFYGGNNFDVGFSIATDSSKNVIFTGQTSSVYFPITVGAFQVTKANYFDAFVVKLDADGNRLWATFYGGNYDDIGKGVCIDTNDNIIIGGTTTSNNIPIVPGGFQPTHLTGGYECFIVKFNSMGIRLWDTYYGGTNWDQVNGICCDRDNNIVIVGMTNSTDFPISAGAFQPAINGFNDAFVVKFDSAGNRVFGTYYGGFDTPAMDDEMANCVATDTNKNIFFTGVTPVANFPLTSNAFQSVNMGFKDCIIVKLDSLGNQLYSSYFGGSSSDSGYGIGIDYDNNLAISGQTASLNFPVTPGAYQTTRAGYADQFVAKFDNNCVRIWATYFGGTDMDESDNGNSLAIAECNKISFTGTTYSTNFPVTGNATQPNIDGLENPFISQLDENGVPTYSTYYGCVHHEYSSIAVGKNNSLLITGSTDNYCFPATDSAFQWSFAGGPNDAFVACDYYDTSHCVIPIIPTCEGILFIPNVFTPNDDKSNDLFMIQVNCIEKYQLKIFNRWGEPVFETNDFNDFWNGKIKNLEPESPDGVYFYLIEFQEIKGVEQIKTGFVTLLR